MSGAVILLGGGAGARLGAGRPKAFVEVGGRSLLSWALQTTSAAGVADLAVVVAPQGWERQAQRAASGCGLSVGIVPAGPQRADSVRRALDELPDAEWVICHDVARPLAPPGLFRSVAAALHGADAVVPVVAVTDTVKRVEDEIVVQTIAREELTQPQTPQAFVRTALVDALAMSVTAPGVASSSGAESSSADEATLLHAAGYHVVTVRGDRANLKVTEPDDLEVVEATLRGRDGG